MKTIKFVISLSNPKLQKKRTLMTQQTTPTTRTALKYGLYVGIASVLLYFLVNITGLRRHPVASISSDVILIVGMVFAMREYKGENRGWMKYWQGVGIGTMVSAITGFLVGIFIMIYLSFNPAIMEYDLQLVLESNEKVGQMMGYTDEMIDQQDEFSRAMVSPPFYFLSYLINYLLFGFIISLVVAAFQRKNKDIFEELDAD